LLAQWNHTFLLVVKLEHIAAAAVLDDGFDVLEVDKVSTVGFEEAAPGEAALQILQGEISDCLFAGSAQVGFALTAGSVEDVAGIVEQDAIFFACGDFERREAFWRGCAGGSLEGIIVHNAPALQFDHPRAAGAGPGQVFVGKQHRCALCCGLFEQVGEEFLGRQVGMQDWLIEQKKPVLPQEHSSEGQAALLGWRELAHTLVCPVAQTNLV
jgi:hypothetical protein